MPRTLTLSEGRRNKRINFTLSLTHSPKDLPYYEQQNGIRNDRTRLLSLPKTSARASSQNMEVITSWTSIDRHLS
ncbi:hypothetical protein OCU04_004739 [Sclerotinia nivalis]|uniref:Uncharacterized protein n=1 Tax=Sclerotinia nivalis TaxID=352851 RepID=A0A9X0ARZ9_9HELO|nr:hypothetical protein OCU04_004739 [Sclerotinia nivalis]